VAEPEGLIATLAGDRVKLACIYLHQSRPGDLRGPSVLVTHWSSELLYGTRLGPQ
jgi:hypothetical protein